MSLNQLVSALHIVAIYFSNFISKSVLHTVVVVFLGVSEIDKCGKKKTWSDSWLMNVMVAYTVWILLYLICRFLVSIVLRNKLLGRSKIGE